MRKTVFTLVTGTLLLSLTLIPGASTGEVAELPGDGGGFRGPCGIMELIEVKGPPALQSGVIDAWTTATPHADPWDEVYSFEIGVDTLAFVSLYYFEEGGYIPLQYIRVWDCGTFRARSTCQYDWTIGPLPPGYTWLLVNYYPPEVVPDFPGDFDWATRVGDSTFGFPDPMNTRPECFTLAP